MTREELTIEQKAKAYNEALEKAKALYKAAEPMSACNVILEIIFPELKEGEDEKIRKELLEHCKNQAKPYIQAGNKCPQIQSWIAWLEKQGEFKDIDSDDLATLEIWEDAIKENKEKWQLSDWFVEATSLLIQKVKRIENNENINIKGSKVMLNACINTLRNVGHLHLSYWLEKHSEPVEMNPSEFDLRLNKLIKQFETLPKEELIGSLSFWLNVVQNDGTYKDEGSKGEQKPFDYETTNIQQKDFASIDPHFGKPIDKVEPKFHEGEWIIHHGTENIYQVVAVIDNQYQLKYGDNYTVQKCADVDRCARLWDVAKDAKDGDVLFHSDSASNGIFIFKELLKYEFSEKVICYCDYDSEDHFCLGEHHTCCWTNAKILYPATNEQRDLLFQKMKDAGYKWDAEKKELKKIK